jgi:DNA modification methylase
MTVKILQGNCLDKLKDLPEQSVNTCITSPPYWGLRDYKEGEQLGLEETPEEFVNNLVEVFREVKRVLRDDGTVWLNLGDSYANQRSGEGADTLKNLNVNTHGYKNPTEKQEKTNKNFNKTLNYGNLKPKNLVGIPWRVAFALQQDGWYVRQDIIWHKPNPMPESVTDRCTKAHEYIFLLSKQAKYYYDNEAIKEDCVGKDERKWSDTYDNVGSVVQGDTNADIKRTKRYSKDGSFKRNKRSVWTVTTKPFKGAHFATFPHDLIEPCVLAGCPEGGTVLDPFGGAGTTALVANNYNRNAILIELNQDYIDLATERLNKECGMFLDLIVN